MSSPISTRILTNGQQNLKKPSFSETYALLNEIGRGSYAKVYKAIDHRTGKFYAVKEIPCLSDHKNVYNENLFSEINILTNCNCENIVRFVASYCSDCRGKVSIVMEYCPGGSVKDVMRNLNLTLTEDQIIVIVRDTLRGLEYLHQKDKIHRDVKAANILLSEHGIAKLGDFGVSEPIDRSSKECIFGTLLWLPPEVINKSSNPSPLIDIWSLGITIIEMGDGQPPYSDIDLHDALGQIKSMTRPAPKFKNSSSWSGSILELLEFCLTKDPASRKNASQLLKHSRFHDTPPNDIVRDLVKRVVSNPTTRTETETNLSKITDHIFTESEILMKIFKQRRFKIVRVDQMASEFRREEEKFNQIVDKLIRRDKRVGEMNNHSSHLVREIDNMQRETNNLREEVKKSVQRKNELKLELGKMNDMKLMSLKSN